MKATLLFLFSLMASGLCAQNLLASRQSSLFSYVYRISNEEAESVYYSKDGEAHARFFHTLVDSFYTDSIPALYLPPGHYLKTVIRKGELQAEILTVPAFQVYLLNNSADLCITVQDSVGRNLSGAIVKAKSRRIRFDEKTQLYRLAKANKKGRLSVSYGGFETWYLLERQRNNPGWRRTLNKKPLRYIWRPVDFALKLPIDAYLSIERGYLQRTLRVSAIVFRDAWRELKCVLHPDDCREVTEDRFRQQWQGYLVFNKPKYLPGDTVKYKAFIVDQKGRPLRDSVTIALYKTSDEYKIMGRIGPYQPGGYAGSFVLHDSLKLKLDKSYAVSVQKAKNKVYLDASFRYEDYELRSITLTLRKEGERHFRGETQKVFLKGTDENDLNLADARVEVMLRPTQALNFLADHLFLPDSLWHWQGMLEPSGETTLTIPDSIFPPLNLEYELSATLLTSDNERQTKRETFTFYHLLEEPVLEIVKDSLQLTYELNGKPTPATGWLRTVDAAGIAQPPRQIELPHQEKLNPHWVQCELTVNDVRREISPSDKPAQLEVLLERGPDTMRMVVVNPRNLPFRYFLYELNREVERGYGVALDLRRKGTGNRKYQIVLQYLWGGNIREDYYDSVFQPGELNISVEQPALVYPGQQVEVQIAVTDVQGKPVPDVDLTAYGLTKKFSYSAPRVPPMGVEMRNRQAINKFSLERKPQKRASSSLDFGAWKGRAGLDTIEYYNFLYPGRNIYRFETRPPDGTTQFSPFVIHNGKVETIHVVYLDHKPVYFSWSENERPYAFHTTPGHHQVSLRTQDHYYSIDSVYMPAGRKLIFSFGDSIQSRHVQATSMEGELSEGEKSNLYRYIFPVRQNFGHEMAYLKQGEEVMLLQKRYLMNTYETRPSSHYGSLLTGPVLPRAAEFLLPDKFRNAFDHEPFFEYEFLNNILKMREINPEKRYPTRLNGDPRESLENWAFSEPYLLRERQFNLNLLRWQNARYLNPGYTLPKNGKLQIGWNEKNARNQPLNILLLRADDPDFLRVYQGTVRLFHDLAPGHYRVVWMYPDSTYALSDSFFVKGKGMNYQRFNDLPVQSRDSFSTSLSQLLEQRVFSQKSDKKEPEKPAGPSQQIYEGSLSPWSGEGRMIRGQVTDETGEPLIGATVLAASGRNGAATDFDGYYSLWLPEGDNALSFSYVGYQSLEIVRIGGGPIVNATLSIGDGILLQEVRVVGYGTLLIQQDNTTSGQALTSENIKNLRTKNINALRGMTAGLEITEDGAAITIRGSRPDAVAYYVDGIRVQGNLIPEIDQSTIANVEVLKGEKATALLGPEAANGAVLITTKKGWKGAGFDVAFLEAASQASSLRTNFSDYAFWQPRLRTDQQGKAVFKVTFPDDITNWRTFVLAMNDRRQSGQAESNIRSFKPLAARLSLPRFLVEGDSAWAIGKVINYTSDTVALRAGFAIGKEELALRDFRIADAVTDSILLAPTTTDSLRVRFSLQKSDGYADGEQRSVEVLRKGMERVEGKFAVLEGDTTLTWAFPDSLGPVTLYARADVLEVVEEEIARLVYYTYDCNEQMASRLKALLAEQQIAAFKGVDFLRKAQVRKMIERLLDNQNEQGLWGWWNRSATSHWISTHVLEALVQAKKMGYVVQIPEQKITEQAVWELESKASNVRKLELLSLLHSFDAKVNYPTYVATLEKDTTFSAFNRFKLMELQQLCGLPWSRDTLARYRKESLFGNVYFEEKKENGHSVCENTLQLTLTACRLLQRDSLSDKSLPRRIRNYLLERRSSGQWDNTYETAQIIAVFMADVKVMEWAMKRPSLQFSGAAEVKVEQFPYQTTLEPGKPLRLSKTGDYPVYFTASQRYWQVAPRENREHFTIHTTFAGGSNRLKAGKPETLIATVEVRKEAQYVMIEVPIPASCSYESKRTGFGPEIHREYFRHKTSIFCEHLKPGTYRFSIELLPRYAGTFTLNPAKVELMYFPVFQSNNEVGKVEVVR